MFLDKFGFISADVEWVDYSSAKLTSDEFDFTDTNQELGTYGSVLNYKFGAELRIKVLRLRAGYSYQEDPLDSVDGLDRSRESLTAGLGLRFKKFYMDASYVRSNYNNSTSPYPGAVAAITENTSEIGVLTLGFKF